MKTGRHVSIRAVAVTALAGLALAGLAGPARANNIHQSCTAGGDKLSTTVYYSASGNYWLVSSNSATIGDNTAGKNNMYMRLRNNGGANEYWAWTSGDNIKGGQTYQIDVNERAPKGGKPYMKTNAIFDQTGSDPNCNTYAYLA